MCICIWKPLGQLEDDDVVRAMNLNEENVLYAWTRRRVNGPILLCAFGKRDVLCRSEFDYLIFDILEASALILLLFCLSDYIKTHA